MGIVTPSQHPTTVPPLESLLPLPDDRLEFEELELMELELDEDGLDEDLLDSEELDDDDDELEELQSSREVIRTLTSERWHLPFTAPSPTPHDTTYSVGTLVIVVSRYPRTTIPF